MSQLNLPGMDNDVQVVPAADQPEPVVWIERLVVVDRRQPDTTIRREVSFRRGLNIIRTEQRQPGERNTVGHDVGKTLLTRLIRYLLGEKYFGTKSVRDRLQMLLPEAYIIGRVFIAGESWIVARPISSAGSKSWAIRGDRWEDILEDSDGFAKYEGFVDRLSHATVAQFADLSLEHAGHEARWVDLLSWLARDQKCAFRSITAWRHIETESGTAPLHSEDANLLIRMAMDLLDTEEKRLIAQHRTLLEKKAGLRADRDHSHHRLDGIHAHLSGHLDLQDPSSSGSLFVDAAKQTIRTKREQLEALLGDFQDATVLTQHEQALLNATEESATVRAQIDEKRNLITLKRAEIGQRESATDQEYLEQFGRMTCGHPACYFKPENRPDGVADPERENRIRELQQEIEQLNAEIAEIEPERERIAQVLESAKADFFAARKEQRRNIRGALQSIGRCDYQQEQLDEYQRCWETRDSQDDRLRTMETTIKDSNSAQAKARDSFQKRKGSLSEYFDLSARALMNAGDCGKIEVDGRGLWAKIGTEKAGTGEASSSGIVLSLDVACMIASICGIGHLPRLHIHDSPREADKELEAYHQLFEFIVSIESLFGDQPPAFQYIVTTTTQPPVKLAKEPYVRGTLHARDDDGLLLKCRF